MPFSRGSSPNLGIEPGSPALQAYSLLSESPEAYEGRMGIKTQG